MARVPQCGKRLVLEFAPEQRAHARARQAEAQVLARLRTENECVAKRGADRRRLDLATFRQRPRATPFVPVGEQVPARRMFHVLNPFATVSCAPGLSPIGTGMRPGE